MTVVVCPLNGEEQAERALSSAFDMAHVLGAPLELFSAVEDSHMRGRREEYLGRVAAQRRPPGAPCPLVSVIVEPHAPKALAALAATPDVITVMATSSQPLLHTGYIGSAAEHVTRDAVNPALLIGPRTATRLSDVQRVVVPCDGSELSEVAVPIARAWAERLKVDLWVVTAIEPRSTGSAGYNASTESNYVRRLAEQGQHQWEVLHGSNSAKEIAEWAGPALTVMTTHGRSGLSRLTTGSVTTGVVRWSTGPVLVANSRVHDIANHPAAQQLGCQIL